MLIGLSCSKTTKLYYVVCVGGNYDFLDDLPMASEFKPFSNFETSVLAFCNGSTFAGSTTLTNSLISASWKYLSGSHCDPYCLVFSYVISVGVGSLSANSVNGLLRSYFIERYKVKWLQSNQGRYYIEHNALRRVPLLRNTNLPEDLPDGLAFISLRTLRTKVSGNNTLSTFLKITVSYAIFRIAYRTFLSISSQVGQGQKQLVVKKIKVSLNGLDILSLIFCFIMRQVKLNSILLSLNSPRANYFTLQQILLINKNYI